MGMRQMFPNMEILMLEANPFCDFALKNTGIPYEMVCLSNEEKEVKFYFEDSNFMGTGASYYIEKTPHYSKQQHVVLQTKLLDDVVGDRSFDFIKMDTQGSELDILRGGQKTAQKAKYILLELSLVEYNEKAPLKDEVIAYMDSIGFKPTELIDTHYHEGVLIQEDWMFTK
jgi:FkbM family methyltransferase